MKTRRSCCALPGDRAVDIVATVVAVWPSSCGDTVHPLCAEETFLLGIAPGGSRVIHTRDASFAASKRREIGPLAAPSNPAEWPSKEPLAG